MTCPAIRTLVTLAGVILSIALTSHARAGAQMRAGHDEILDRAEAAAEQGHLDDALKACQQVLAQDPNSAHALYLVGVIDLERGQDQEAKNALVKSVTADSSRIATHIALGKVYLSLRDWKPAAEQFQMANDLGDSTGSGHFGLGVALLRESQYSQALLHLQKAVETNPREPEWLLALVGADLQIKKVSDARLHTSQLAKLSPDDAATFYRLGKLYAEQKLAKDAEVQFQQAVALFEKTPSGSRRDSMLADLRFQIARARFDQHDYEGSVESLRQTEPASLGPKTRAAVQHVEGESFLGQRKFDAARDKLRQAAESDPSSPDYAFDWAWAEMLAGNVQSAAAVMSSAMNKWPNVPDIRMLQAVLQRENTPERLQIPFMSEWHLKGQGMVCCPCKVPCPCRSNGPSTYGHCESVGAYRIAEGHYQSVPLDGLTFISLHACMGPDNIPSVLYVHTSVPDDKVIALERIFQALNPVRPFVFVSVCRVALSFISSEDAKSYEATVPGVIELKIKLMDGGSSQPVLRTAALDRFSNLLEYARNVIYKVWDDNGALKWDYSGRQANFRTIDLDAHDYADQTMLIQFADGTGFFTDREMDLIRKLNLPTLSIYPRPTQ